MLRALERLVHGVEQAGAAFSVVILAAIMSIVSADVAMRYVFNRPFGWTYDLISLYLMTAMFYLSLSPTFAEGAHIGVDVLQPFFGWATRRVMQIFTALVSAGLFAVIAWLIAGRTRADFLSGAATSGEVLWPSWLAEIVVPLGTGLLCLRLLVHALGHGLSLATGRDIVPLPPLAGETEGAGRGFE